jgi:mandelate racemase
MDFGANILAEPYAVVDGRVTPKGPGLGIGWNEDAVARYALR